MPKATLQDLSRSSGLMGSVAELSALDERR
jgi:hypothetical protein